MKTLHIRKKGIKTDFGSCINQQKQDWRNYTELKELFKRPDIVNDKKKMRMSRSCIKETRIYS